jgi:hypothetical protein
MAPRALASSAVKSNPDHYQDSLICWFRMGSLVFAGLAGSDRWPSSMSGTEMVGAPATRFHGNLDRGFSGRASCAVAPSWLWRSGEGGADLAGRWPSQGKKRWHSPPLPPGDHVAPWLLAATPLNDSFLLRAMGQSANCSADPCAVSPLDLHRKPLQALRCGEVTPSRGPPETERRPGRCLSVAVQPSGADGSRPSCGGSVSAQALPGKKSPTSLAGPAPKSAASNYTASA